MKNVIPDGSTWILNRHGDKTKNDGSSGGELTPLGKMQNASASIQLLEHCGLEELQKAIKLTSPVYRVGQAANIALALWDSVGQDCAKVNELEWGPGYPDHSELIINKMIGYGENALVIAFGHDGLFQNMARRLGFGNPKLGRGCAFILTATSIKLVKPQI